MLYRAIPAYKPQTKGGCIGYPNSYRDLANNYHPMKGKGSELSSLHAPAAFETTSTMDAVHCTTEFQNGLEPRLEPRMGRLHLKRFRHGSTRRP